MPHVTVAMPRQHNEGGWPAVSAEINVDGYRYDITIRASQGPLTARANPFVALALLPAMRLGADLHIEAPVSPRLLRNLSRIQDIMCSWYREFRKVAILATAQARYTPSPSSASAVGCFFSGGVDSSYTLLRHQADISHLIIVHGFDVAPGKSALWNNISQQVGNAALQLDKSLIEVETNARSLLDDYTIWDEHSDGAALASVALALAPRFQIMYIAGGYPYDVLMPRGSHALLDPLWSTEVLEIIHDADQANRWQKLATLVSSEVALQWLRVCWHNTDGAYNCGLCRKCLSVMAYLEAAGALQRCPTFKRDVDLKALASVSIGSAGILYLQQTLLTEVERLGTRPEIADAIRTSINQSAGNAASGQSLAAMPQERSADLEADIEKAERRLSKLKARLHHMEQSRSWRWTAPLRRAADLARQLPDKKQT